MGGPHAVAKKLWARASWAVSGHLREAGGRRQGVVTTVPGLGSARAGALEVRRRGVQDSPRFLIENSRVSKAVIEKIVSLPRGGATWGSTEGRW